jgi:thiol-disulfide isomerase/thioredoxin
MGRQLGNGIILLPDSQQFLIFVVHLYQLGSMRYRLQGVWVVAMACVIVTWAGVVRAQRPEIIHIQQVQAWDQADNDTLYVLNFWATWCKPCVAEMPYFDQVQRELEEQKVKVIFISMDFSNEYEKRLVPFVARKKLYSKVVMLDEPKYNDWIDLVSPAWSGAIPATLMVQHSRGIREFHEGEYTYESLKSKIESLINQ